MALTFTPSVKFFHHQLGSVPGLNFLANVNFDGTWYVHNDPSMVFTFNGANVPEIQGSGDMNIQIKLSNAVNGFDEGMYELQLRAFSSDGSEEESMTVYLLCTVADDDVVLPKNLQFEAVRNVKDAEEQRFFVATGQSGITINLPAWLTLVSHELNGGGHIVTVKPVTQGATPNPQYTDNIEVLIPGEPNQYINCKYTIHAGYDEKYTKPVHFTRDDDELEFWQTTPEKSFLRLAMDIKSFSDKNILHSDTQLSLDIPFVDNRAKINIGRELEDYMFTEIGFSNTGKSRGVYPPLELRATAIEFKQDDFSILNQDILPLQYYLNGRNPLNSRSVAQPFWCVFRPSAARLISSAGIVSLTVFKPAAAPTKNFILKKNGQFVKNITPQNQSFGQMRPYLITANVKMSDLQLAVGDVLSFEYEGMLQRLEFIIRPPVKESIPVAFQTVFNTYEVFEFTGGYLDGIDYEHSLVESLKKYLRVTRKISTHNPQKVTLNTGWILKSEVFLINELINSKRALIPAPGTVSESFNAYALENPADIELIPVSSKMTAMDSENNRRQYDIEFLINPNYENDILSRGI